MSDIDPLPPDLADLLARSRPLDAAPVPARERLERRIALSAAAGPPSPTADGPPGATPPDASPGANLTASALSPLAQKIAIGLICFAAGGVIGAATYAAWRPGEPANVVAAPLSPPVPVIALSPPAASQSSIVAIAPSDLPNVAMPPGAPSVDVRHAAPGGDRGASDLAEERRLLDVARGALTRGEPASAISPLDEHARRFAHGVLAEERDALSIQALARAGRAREAAERAAHFRQAYPESFMTPAVDNAIESSHDN